jgi:hypothetical protein
VAREPTRGRALEKGGACVTRLPFNTQPLLLLRKGVTTSDPSELCISGVRVTVNKTTRGTVQERAVADGGVAVRECNKAWATWPFLYRNPPPFVVR